MSIRRVARTAFGDMPQDSGRIDEIGDAEPPRLYRRRFWRGNAEGSGQVERLEVCPPCIEVIHHQLHHAVLRPLLIGVGLQDESTVAGGEDRNLTVQELLEAQRFIEADTARQITGREKGAGVVGFGMWHQCESMQPMGLSDRDQDGAHDGEVEDVIRHFDDPHRKAMTREQTV
ncbi:MAG: hypothetical protein RLZZ621_728 [Gemmatimonadota bacterium]